MQTKENLRNDIVSKLGSQSPDDRFRRSALIQKKLFRLKAFQNAKAICVYVSLPTEVDTAVIIDTALKKGKKVLVPLANLENKELSLYEIKNREHDLKKGSYGIFEPDPEKTRLAAAGEADCLIIPGIVFDKENNRIGRGKGFYDRFLQKVKRGAYTVGLAFSFQVVPEIPAEVHDVKCDIVLTD